MNDSDPLISEKSLPYYFIFPCDFGNLKKCFDFIENVLSENDRYSEEVITFSVLERIYDDTGKKYENFMKNKTKKLFYEVIKNYFN